MLKWICGLLAVVCVVLAVCLRQTHQSARQLLTDKQNLTAVLAVARQQQVLAREKTATLAKEVAILQQRLGPPQAGATAPSATTEGATKSTTMAARQSGATASRPADGKNTDFFGKFGEMMKKPELQEAMRAQQKAMLGTMYGALFKKLNLAPDALDQFKELLLDRQMAGIAAFGGGAGKTAVADITTKNKQVDEAMAALLDDEQYKIYQDYQVTLGERMTLSQFTQQLADKAVPLDDAQQEELVTLMVEERQKLAIGSVTEQQQQAMANGMPTSEMMEKQIQQQEELQKRIYARAGEILSEAQKQELKAFQENQAKIQKLGLQFMKSFADNAKK